MEIRLLCDYRETLVNERTRLINRLRINLVILDPELEASIPSRELGYPGQRQRVVRRLRAMPQTARVRVAREQVKRIGVLTREADELKRELRDLVAAHRPELLAETGRGPLTAAILIGQTAGAERFHSDAHFARMAGVPARRRPVGRPKALRQDKRPPLCMWRRCRRSWTSCGACGSIEGGDGGRRSGTSCRGVQHAARRPSSQRTALDGAVECERRGARAAGAARSHPPAVPPPRRRVSRCSNCSTSRCVCTRREVA